MDETRLIAGAQLRMFGRAAGLSRETVEQQFEAIFNTPPEPQKPGRRPQAGRRAAVQAGGKRLRVATADSRHRRRRRDG
jgi:hypothetical protein